jgi:hypothetical protein
VDELVKGLAPAFAAGFAIQRLLEIADHLLGQPGATTPAGKKTALATISLVVAVALAAFGEIRVLDPLGIDATGADVVVTALVISAGTEGANSIMKFLGYKKAEKEAEAKKAAGTTTSPPAG